jgi:hypothetical protein
MNGSARAGLAAIAAAWILVGCSAVEPRREEVAPLPEPPPWNSIEMLWLDTEVALLQAPRIPAGSFSA